MVNYVKNLNGMIYIIYDKISFFIKLDFGQAPLLVNACYSSGECIQLAIATAKSGITWALNAATGEIVWSTNSGPGAVGGKFKN
jgi:outer membrane protein assembly factor BamB